MHRIRHNRLRIAGPLREAAAQADWWALQLDRLKESLPASAFTDAPAAALAGITDSVEPVGHTEGRVEPPDQVSADGPGVVVPSPQAPLAAQSPLAASDSDPRFTGAINWPPSSAGQPAFVDEQPAAGNAVRAVERSSMVGIAGDNSVGETASGSAGNAQDPAALLTQTNQQLELIRQTLEKILAKPGSVVLD